MLMPAGVLIVLLLGAVAVDAAVVFLAERELANATAAAANDAAGAALDDAAFYQGGRLVLDPSRAEEVARQSLAARRAGFLEIEEVDVDVTAVRVTVRVAAQVEHVFARAVPGAPRTARVEARSTAEAVPG
jgi:hypothetical protein